MTKTLLLLLLFNFVGEAITHQLGLPLPGPLVGLVLMIGYLWFHKPALLEMQPSVAKILRHLSLFFVPAGVGIIAHTHLLRAEGSIILVAIIVSTVLTLAVTALSFQFALRLSGNAQTVEA